MIRLLCVLAVMGMVASTAPALTITQTKNYGDIPNFSVPLTFDYFDTNLGTLDSVTIEVSMTTAGGFGIVDNDSGTTASVTIKTDVSATATSSDVFLPSAVALTSVNQAFNLDPEDGDGAAIDGAAPDGGTLNVPVGTFSSGVLGTTAGQRATFGQAGGGTYTIDLNALQNTFITVGGGVATGNNPASVSGFVEVIYNYTEGNPVPTPAAAGMILGLGGLGLLRRRR
jgi:MYXO-CTERM domain-containing protein